MEQDITKCITTRYNGKQLLLFIAISRKGKEDVIILNCDMPEELLRKRLMQLKYRKRDIDRILTAGIRLSEKRRLTFKEEVTITTTTQTGEQMWLPYHKGDTVKLYPDGSFEKVSRGRVIMTYFKEWKEDIITSFQELDEEFVEMMDEHLS